MKELETTQSTQNSALSYKKSKKGGRVQDFLKKNYQGWLFVLPLFIGIVVFSVYPIIQSIYYSFHDFNGITDPVWNNFGNFTKMVKNPYEWTQLCKVVSNTLIYAFASVIIGLFLSYFLALLLNKPFKGLGIFRMLIYMPVVIPGIVSALIYRDMFDVETGIINQIITAIGLPAGKFFTDPSTAMITLIFSGFWTLGGSMLLWLSAFKNIPSSLYEAAKIDGAGRVAQTFHVTIPLSTPMIFYNAVTGIIGALQVFNTNIIVGGTGTGPQDSLYFMAIKVYNEAFRNFNMGYACALGWILFLIIAALTVVIFKTSKWVFYGEDMA